MKRQAKQLPATAQGSFGFTRESVAWAATPTQIPSDDWFQPDGHLEFYLGPERLDAYLKRVGSGWVLGLRGLLEELNWELLTRAYQLTGRKAKHPRVMLGLIVYGIVSGRWSLRDLEEMARLDAGAWWVCGGHQPDHSTIGEFIQRHAAVLTTTFFESLVKYVVARLRLQVGTVAIDGTVIESAASRFHMLKLEAAREAARLAEQSAQADPEDHVLQAQAKIAAELANTANRRAQERVARGREAAGTSVAGSDPEAVLQPRKDGAWRPGYKPSVMVHASGVIIAQSVHPSSEVAQVEGLLAQHSAVFGAPPATALLDANYHCSEVLSECIAQDVDVLCPSGATRNGKPCNKRGVDGRFAKTDFVYDANCDSYRCPAGNELRRSGRGTNRHGQLYTRYRTDACRRCPLRVQCTTASQGRVIDRYDSDEFKALMRSVLEHPVARKKYRERAPIAERPYAELTERQRLRRFHRRGRLGVGVEFALHCIAFDLKVALRAALRLRAFLRPWCSIRCRFSHRRPSPRQMVLCVD